MSCACGAEVYIKKTQECRACYLRRWHAEHPEKYEQYTGKPRRVITTTVVCACGGTKTRKATQCIECRWANKMTDEQRRAKRLADKKLYKQRHPEKERMRKKMQNHNRRVRGGEPLTSADIAFILLLDQGMCQKCGATEDLHLDHIMPLSKGGTNDMNNLQHLCAPCNLNKSASYADYRRNMLAA